MSTMKPQPIFIGGTGRSGTTILGDLLGSDPRIRLSKPTEIKFLSNHAGLLDVAFGLENAPFVHQSKFVFTRSLYLRRLKLIEKKKKRFSVFEEYLFERWWNISTRPPYVYGLKSGISEERMLKLLSNLKKRHVKNSLSSCRKFFYEFVVAQDDAADELFWVETTPMNIASASRIRTLIPNARFINMVRDPRDVIASLMKMHWGPEDPMSGLQWVEKRLLAGSSELKKLPNETYLTISLESFSNKDRDETFAKLFNWIGIEPSQPTVDFLNTVITGEKTSAGRWRTEIDSPEFRVGFKAMCQRLEAAGVDFYYDKDA